MVKIFEYPAKAEWNEIIKRPVIDTKSIEKQVIAVLDDIKNNGDKALKYYTKKFDNVDIQNIKVDEHEIHNAYEKVDSDLKYAISIAAANIRKFHEAQKTEIKYIETTEGVKCWQKAVAIEKVGLYIPGGTAPLFSTVLMLGIPALIAGCNKIVLCSPPDANGEINPAILYSASYIGITDIYKLGGVQAIAAMAYGTVTVPKVYKIFGPGNQYVTVAKQIVSRADVAIDMPAGPSEVAIIADESANPLFVALDMLSQAEHGTDSQALLVTNSKNIIDEVIIELNKELDKLPRKHFALKSLQNSKIVLLDNYDKMIEFINFYAPEHLIISTQNYLQVADKIINAGSVFLGNFSPESAGDYASGTNHTLPTNGFARVYNGTNLDDYVKKITFQELTPQGIKNLAPVIIKMAETEQLDAHKNATIARVNHKKNS
jgi:histidinol dehydrogenase